MFWFANDSDPSKAPHTGGSPAHRKNRQQAKPFHSIPSHSESYGVSPTVFQMKPLRFSLESDPFGTDSNPIPFGVAAFVSRNVHPVFFGKRFVCKRSEAVTPCRKLSHPVASLHRPPNHLEVVWLVYSELAKPPIIPYLAPPSGHANN